MRRWAINAQVRSSYSRRDPDVHLSEIAASLGLAGSGVGMLTSAQVADVSSATDGDVEVSATVGLGHPTLAAAPVEEPGLPAVGTINLVALVPVCLSDAALVNAVSTITEAKVQALYDSGLSATGTATDAVCLVCNPDGAEPVLFAGPRSQWGSRLARATYSAVHCGASAYGAREP